MSVRLQRMPHCCHSVLVCACRCWLRMASGAVRYVAAQHLTARSARRSDRHFSQEHAPLPVNECLRLASTFHSMHAIAGNLTPVPLPPV